MYAQINSNTKSGFPYLVDLNITNACPYECEFCYTSSVPKGDIGDWYEIYYIITELAKCNVFELVLGGGEPSLHKNICTILDRANANKFIVGLTTRNYNLHKHENYNNIVKNINSLALSCNSIKDLEKTSTLRKALKNEEQKPILYIQNILGLQPFDELIDFFKYCTENYLRNVTLLGYKNFGFGENVKPHLVPDDWVEQIKKVYKGSLGADSILVQKYRENLLANGVESYYLVGSEGKQTCYIDAVKRIIKPSSFVGDDKGVKYTKEDVNRGKFADLFMSAFSKF